MRFWATQRKLRVHPTDDSRPASNVPEALSNEPIHGSKTQWLNPVQHSATTIATRAMAPGTIASVVQSISRLEPDDYLGFMLAYYQSGLRKFEGDWRYMDLLTVLHASAVLLRPSEFLEIGVRRGRSMAVVARAASDCDFYGFDPWMPDYAGMPNPGPDFVRSELRKMGHQGRVELVSGDSHQTVPQFLRAHPDLQFDLINVDGDHSEQGAREDLLAVLPRLRQGGVIVLDDIMHPQHRYLESVWDASVGNDLDFHSFKYRDLGYGVALAVRRN